MTDTTKRSTTATVVGLKISPARIRNLIDRGMINFEQEKRKAEINAKVQVIKREGCTMPVPEKPKAPGRGALPPVRAKYNKALSAYTEKMKAYNKYKSPRYEKLKLVHGYYKQLVKLQELLSRESLTDVMKFDADTIYDIINDKPLARKPNESDEKYDKRTGAFKKFRGYSKIKSPHCDLSTAYGVQLEMDRLLRDHPQLDIWVSKQEVSQERVRFGAPAVVALATAAETCVEQFIQHTVTQTIIEEKVTMGIDSCVSDGLEKTPLYSLFANSPHLATARQRQQRYDAWLVNKKQAAIAHKLKLQNAKKAAKNAAAVAEVTGNENKNGKLPKFEYPKFEQTEVDNGFAVSEQAFGKKADGTPTERTVYKWKGLDAESENIDFEIYVRKIWNKVRDDNVATGNTAVLQLRFGSDLCTFLSNLVVDFITRVTPMAVLLMEIQGAKTLSSDIILSVLKLILVDSYTNKSAYTELSHDHQDLFNDMQVKINRYKNYHSTDEPAEEETIEYDTEMPDPVRA